MNQQTSPKWPLWQTFAFRACSLYFIFFFLFKFGMDFGTLDKLPEFLKYGPRLQVSAGLMSAVNWLFIHQKNVFPVLYVAVFDGYWPMISMVTYMVVAMIAALTWTMIDKGKRFPSYYKFAYTLIRYLLALALLRYGISKLLLDQMQFFADKLNTPIGNLDPHQFFWTFMSLSKAYQFFAGLLEVGAGALLLFRRTATLGALMSILVLINVLILDVGYDTYVKLICFQLILYSLFLVAPRIKQLYTVIILNRTAPPSPELPQLIENKKYRWVQYALKVGVVGYILFGLIKSHQEDYYTLSHSTAGRLAGIYDIKDFAYLPSPGKQKNVDSAIWMKMGISHYPSMSVSLSNGSTVSYNIVPDTIKRLLKIQTWTDTTTIGKIHYAYIKPDELLFKGTFKKDSIQFTLKKQDMYKTPLLKTYGKVQWTNF